MISFEEILAKYKPDSEERSRIDSLRDNLLKQIHGFLASNRIDARPVLVGSVAKGTNLKGGDLDIFIVFSKKYSTGEMEKTGLKIGHTVIPGGKEKYAEHPYVSGTIDGTKIDIVPCFDITANSKLISSVDRTPLHTDYVLKNIDEKKMDEVRLLKLFMKRAGVYGSEIKVSGFSGYVCEILVIKFGSFIDVIKMFARSKGPVVVSEDDSDVIRFHSAVIIIDPTDRSRNAAAAVSEENLARMKIASKMFLGKPDPGFFGKPKDFVASPYRDRGTVQRIFLLEKPDIIDDVLYSQAIRFKGIIFQILEEEGFYPISSEFAISDEIEVFVECKLEVLPKTKVHTGPPVDTPNVKEFIEKWSLGNAVRGPYICGDRLCVDIELDRRTIEEVVRKRIMEYGIGKNIDPLKNAMKIIDPSKTGRKFLVLGKFYEESIL